MTPDLVVPDWLSPPQRAALVELVERNDRAHGYDLLGIVLSGSAGRNYATEHSDLDVMVVLADDAAASRTTVRSPDVDEIPERWSHLLTVAPFRTEAWWMRWCCAWAPVARTQAGDVSAVRESIARVRAACAAYDEGHGHTRTTDMIDGWGPDLGLFALSR